MEKIKQNIHVKSTYTVCTVDRAYVRSIFHYAYVLYGFDSTYDYAQFTLVFHLFIFTEIFFHFNFNAWIIRLKRNVTYRTVQYSTVY